MRRTLSELRTGEVDSIRGYPVTQTGPDEFARIDFCIAGFRGLLARLTPSISMAPLSYLEGRLSAGVPITVQAVDAAFRTMSECEDALVKLDRSEIKAAVLTESISIEFDALGDVAKTTQAG